MLTKPVVTATLSWSGTKFPGMRATHSGKSLFMARFDAHPTSREDGVVARFVILSGPEATEVKQALASAGLSMPRTLQIAWTKCA